MLFLMRCEWWKSRLEVYNVPEHEYADAYLIQGTESNLHRTSPFLEPFEAMYNEGAPEFVVDQGMFYPTATNYGYICTGLESPGEWDDHHRVFRVDGQDIQFVGAQTENLPYVYYTPSYGCSQSPYNPYNPYIPGAMMGADGSFMGTQQHYIPYDISYDNATSSSAYYPMIVQTPDVTLNGTTDSYVDTSAYSRADGLGFRRNSSAANHGRGAPNQSNSFQKDSEGFKANGGSSKPATNGSVVSGSFSTPASSQFFQGRGVQSIDDHGKALSNRNQLNVAAPDDNGLSNFRSSAHGGVNVDKVRLKLQSGGVLNDVNESPDALMDQNRGHRTKKSKNQLVVKAYTNRAGDSDAKGYITIYTDQYNKDDFPIDNGNAKFFVIKSYSEDDVHKSIKYNVWSSTPNGNTKLNSAYEDAQKIALGQPGGCPIFFFFSVNASGQFCGVAEMTGPVDFHRDMDFWQQDKWSGSFPVKWHIVKDVPNPNFRHIILENNEHKPVTNSRDTQEIRLEKGVEMLKVFKNYTSKTSLLDDFMYYENRQRILQEEKARRILINSYGTPLFVPVLDAPPNSNSLVNFPSNVERKIILQNDSNTSDGSAAPSKSNITDDKVKEVADYEIKIGSLSISPKSGETNSGMEPSNTKVADVVTVGSMAIKVNGLKKPSGVLTVGTISLDPCALQAEIKGVPSNTPKAGLRKI